jgi:phosphoglycerate kinase
MFFLTFSTQIKQLKKKKTDKRTPNCRTETLILSFILSVRTNLKKGAPRMTLACHIPEWDLANKRVFLRADLNVPLKNGAIDDDYRLRAIVPTIKLLQEKGALVLLATHIGRPKTPDPKLSTRLLIPWLAQQGFTVTFAQTPQEAARLLSLRTPLVLLENLRFFPGEQAHASLFAQELANLGDFYVNDAFGTLHRADTSVTLVPPLLPPEKRSIGLLVERELAALEKIRTKPEKPFVAIIGGGKVADKLPLLTGLLSHADTILLCPALVFTFLQAQKKPVGKSLVDPTHLTACSEFLELAKHKQVNIVFPLDYQIALNTIAGSLTYVDAETIPSNGIGISIGPKTIAAYTQILNGAHTTFFNAAMGFSQREETLHSTYALLQTIAKKADTTRVVGGGDSIAAVQKCGLEKKIGYLSTGGGATLAYISGAPLPGLAVLDDGTKTQ